MRFLERDGLHERSREAEFAVVLQDLDIGGDGIDGNVLPPQI